MDWNKKVAMIELFNNRSSQLPVYLKEHAKEITEDYQAFDMYLTSITISEEEINKNKELYKLLMVSDAVLNQLSWRSRLRYEIYRGMVLDSGGSTLRILKEKGDPV